MKLRLEAWQSLVCNMVGVVTSPRGLIVTTWMVEGWLRRCHVTMH